MRGLRGDPALGVLTTIPPAGSRRRWIPPPPDADARAAALGAALPMPESLARVLAARGLDDLDVARAFLRPVLDRLHDPFGLPDMAEAVGRLEAAIDAGETIFVHGDFDADGMSAAALATRGLRRVGARATPFVPHRTRDGYDLTPATVERAAAAGAGVVLTVDCGVTAVAAVDAARAAGIDVVVTDHHRPGPGLPAAIAVVNPMRSDADYPFRDLAGVGVAFKLVAALFARRGVPDPELYQHLDLVAVGTVCDHMPLLGENRVLVRAGLRALAHTRKPGLRALMRRAAIDPGRSISTDHLAFRLGPRLNSVGRMAAAETGLRLLLTDDPSEAETLAAHLEEQNAARRQEDRQVTAQVERSLGESFDAEAHSAVVVWGDDWHPGVVGIVASRVVERWNRPAVVVSFDGDDGVGSGRSIDGFHLFDALHECRGLLDRFGGHRMAAGLSIQRNRIEEFAGRLREIAATRLAAAREPSPLCIDLALPLPAVTAELYDQLRHLGPCGNGNPAPVLAVRGVALARPAVVGAGGAHLRLALDDGRARLPAIGFRMGGRLPEASASARFDVAFHLERDHWRARERLQARLLDFRPSIP